MTTYSSMQVPLVILFATAGSLLGAYALYAVGRIISRERLMTFFGTKPLRLLGFKPEDVAKAVDWFTRKGSSTVFFCRFIPVVRSLISIPAGTARMSLVKFTLLTTAGSLIWNTVLILLGRAFGAAWEQVGAALDVYSNIAYVILGILLIAGAVWVYLTILKPRREAAHIQDAMQDETDAIDISLDHLDESKPSTDATEKDV